MSMDRFLLAAHRYLGLLAAVVIITIGTTGAILVFEKEIDHMCAPELWTVIPHGQRLPLQMLLERVRTVYPQDALTSIDMWADPRRSAVIETDMPRQIFLNPYTGQILGEREYEKTFFGIVLALHRTLLTGKVGQTVVGITTLLIILLLMTGLYLWWPQTLSKMKSSLAIKWTASRRRVNYDLHNTLGFYASWYLMVIALTGLVWSFSFVEAAIYWLTNSPPPLRKTTLLSRISPGATPLSVDEIASRAEAVLPGGERRWISLPNRPEDPVRVIKGAPRPGNPNALHNIYLDQYTGELLRMERYEDLSLGETIRLLVYPIHVGAIFGLPTQILALLASAVMPVSAVTGFLIWWWNKRRPTREHDTLRKNSK